MMRLTSGPRIHVSRALKRTLEAASISAASYLAEVLDADGNPALVLVVGDELVLVCDGRVSRWPASELARVEGELIITRDGTRVPIGAWSYTTQGETFRAGLQGLLSQPEPASEAVRSTPGAGNAVVGHAGDGSPRRKPAGDILGTVFGCLILALIGIFVVWKVTGHSAGIASNNNDAQTPSAQLTHGLHLFPEGKTLYWIGQSLAGYRIDAIYAHAGDPIYPGAPAGEHETTILYRAKSATQDTRLEVRTYVRPHPKEPLDYPALVRIYTRTGQLVVFDAPGGNPPPRELLARLAKALRPVSQADIANAPQDYWPS